MGLLLGLLVTLAAVVSASWYVVRQMSGLRALQSDLADRNRKDSLQLLRIQNDLNSLGLAMRDMLDAEGRYPLEAWTTQFDRIRRDLDSALPLEDQLAVASRTPDQRRFLATSVTQFWDAADRIFVLARAGQTAEARAQVRLSLQARQESLAAAVSRLLVENYTSDEQTAARTASIYDQIQRQVFAFLSATFVVILLTGLYLIRSNRRILADVLALSSERRELVQRLITTREATLQQVSRELHDEFGQILTAMGAMLGRAGAHAPEGSRLRADLREICEIAQSTLDKVRSLSQALHPSLLAELGLDSTIDWYLPSVERQYGATLSYQRTGAAWPIDPTAGVHIYRVLQEALQNMVRHSGANRADVRLRYTDDALELEVEDRGRGLGADSRRGLGIVGMRERAELVSGTLTLSTPAGGGTCVSLRVPRNRLEMHGE
jgi:signal transduction histidine kinase